jgi:multidrug efflux pump subunit AcrA (membrane-fusion protein)
VAAGEGEEAVIRALRRAYDRVFDWMSMRPLSIVVFAASVAALAYMQTINGGQFRVRAVAYAPTIEHPALVSSYVSEVYARPGDRVEVGAPLVELSSYFIDQELERVNTKVEQLLRESRLAQARLLVDEERWLERDMRRRPNEPSLKNPTESLFAAELQVLTTRRSQLEAAQQQLTVHTTHAGRVAMIAPPGSSVAIGTSVASVTPEYAEEIVAYLPPETDPVGVMLGAPVTIVRPRSLCGGTGSVLRRGAAVEEAPGQLTNFLRFPVHGTPVYISIPAGCSIGVGQVLAVQFSRVTS